MAVPFVYHRRLSSSIAGVLRVAAELRRRNRAAPVTRALRQHYVMPDQLLYRRLQQELLLAGLYNLPPFGHEKLAGQGDLFRQRTEAVRLLLSRVE